jgi:hypothetical protein
MHCAWQVHPELQRSFHFPTSLGLNNPFPTNGILVPEDVHLPKILRESNSQGYALTQGQTSHQVLVRTCTHIQILFAL